MTDRKGGLTAQPLAAMDSGRVSPYSVAGAPFWRRAGRPLRFYCACMTNRQRIGLVLVIAGLAVLEPRRLRSCSGGYPSPIFHYEMRPRNERAAIFSGKLGILHSTYDTEYLVAAYRALTGAPLTPGEAAEPPAADALAEWNAARGRYPRDATEPAIVPTRRREQWQTFVNCGDDAFRTAALTLAERERQFGASSAWMVDWVKAQDAVFSNCEQDRRLPTAIARGAPAVFAADRAYQIAAAHFYRLNFDEARRRMLAISADARSLWRGTAAVVAARCLVRQSLLSGGGQGLLDQAERELAGIGTPGALRLRRHVLARLRPDEVGETLGQMLAKPADAGEFRLALADYRYLRESYLRYRKPRTETGLHQWVQAVSSQEAEAAIERWRAQPDTVWLVAALLQVKPGHPAAGALLAAARRVRRDSPAWPTVTYHRFRLQLAARKQDAVRSELDRLLPWIQSRLPVSARNQFRAQRMQVAESLDAFVRFAVRRRVDWVLYGERQFEDGAYVEGKPREWLDRDAVDIVNRGLTLAQLAEAAQSPLLPAHVRRGIAVRTWVQAALVENRPAAEATAPQVLAAHPAIRPWFEAYQRAQDPEERRFALAYLLLRSPALSLTLPENGYPPYRWCAPTEKAAPAPFLTSEERTQVVFQWADREQLDSAPNHLGREVIRWARRHPEDPRSPEALHRVVRLTRYGCIGEDYGAVSKEAFELLHARWPKSEWARNTPYWFR